MTRLGVAVLVEVSRRSPCCRSATAPYPWPAFTLALTPGMKGGIEYPGHVMQGPSTNARTTPHEVAHQWFYALVGNNQGRDPWLDEGLATWAEAQINGTYSSFVRAAIPADGRGHLGEPMTFWDAHAAATTAASTCRACRRWRRSACRPRRWTARWRATSPRTRTGSRRRRRWPPRSKTVAPERRSVLARYGAQRRDVGCAHAQCHRNCRSGSRR